MRSVLYTRGIASQHLIMRPRRLAYDVLNAVAGDRLEELRWRRAQSTPKVLASTVYPATLLEISLHRVTIAAWAPKTYEPVAECVPNLATAVRQHVPLLSRPNLTLACGMLRLTHFAGVAV